MQKRINLALIGLLAVIGSYGCGVSQDKVAQQKFEATEKAARQELEAAEEEFDAAKSEYELAKEELEAVEELFENGEISDEEFYATLKEFFDGPHHKYFEVHNAFYNGPFRKYFEVLHEEK